jgi:hypothetical protein
MPIERLLDELPRLIWRTRTVGPDDAMVIARSVIAAAAQATSADNGDEKRQEASGHLRFCSRHGSRPLLREDQHDIQSNV